MTPKVLPENSQADSKKKEKVTIGMSGIHVQDGDDEVSIGPSGIKVKDKDGDDIEIGLGGINIKSKDEKKNSNGKTISNTGNSIIHLI